MDTFITTLFASNPYLDVPQGLIGWLTWMALLALVIYLLFKWREYNNPSKDNRGAFLVGLAVLELIATGFLGVRLPVGNALPLPGTPTQPVGPALMFLAAVPWCLAGGFLGPAYAGGLAFLSGGLLALFNSHNPFMPLIYMLMAMSLSVLFRQRYRTSFYRAARIPLVSGVLIGLAYPFIYGLSAVLVADGSIGVRLDYMLSIVDSAWLAFAGQLAFGVLFAQVISVGFQRRWRPETARKPSPRETSLENRLVNSLMPLSFIFVVLVILLVGGLLINANRDRLGDQMQDIAQSSANSIPFGLETGQNLIVQLAEDPRLLNLENSAALRQVLIEYLNRVPFFTQLTYLDRNNQLVAAYPVEDLDFLFLTPVEVEAIELAQRGVVFQSYSLQPEPGQAAGRLVFVVAVQGDSGQSGIILGRSRLDQNPFFIPVIDNLSMLEDFGGAGMMVDDEGMVLYHPNPGVVGSEYEGEINLQEPIYDTRHTSPEGIREILYQYPVPGRPWVVITTVPVAVAQQLALQTSLPLFGMLLLLLLFLYAGIRFMLRRVTSSIRDLADEARRISAGDLDHSLKSERVDEVGQLANSLDEMRQSLKTRIEENARLLSVSKGVASALEMEMAVKPILQGALSTGASAARLVLAETAIPDYEEEIRTQFGLGPFAEQYKNLDKQILGLTMQQSEVLLTNPSRARLQNPGKPLPESILAIALYHENVYYGALWIGFDKPHQLSENDRRFMKAIAGQAALAASNARLYLSAQLGRQRMEAILESTPEPVLVTDYQDQLLLVNRAAQLLLNEEKDALEGSPVEEVVKEPKLREELLSDRVDKPGSPPVEIELTNGRVYFATSSSVQVDDKKMGRVVLLRDVTHYKELDALKSEFVDTVNHDLRSPLTTMRGYATMLDLVGDLNEQQTKYVGKIVQGVENMSRLVNTLLDLGRIEAGVGLHLEMLPISDVVRQVAEALRMEAVQRKIDYQLHLPESTTPLVEADQALIERAIQNLIDNAIKYSDADGEVHITLKQPDDEHVVIEIKDSGIGVSPVDIPRLFERFYRASGRKTVEERGSGLGLAIVKSIAERHHGSVSVKSQLGKGSTFTLKLPIKQPK